MNITRLKYFAFTSILIVAIAVQSIAQKSSPPFFEFKTDAWVKNKLEKLTLDDCMKIIKDSPEPKTKKVRKK